jgi:hypothetical protein
VPVYTSVASAIDRKKLASDVVYLILLEIDVLDLTTRQVVETLRLVQNDEDYVFQGATYMKAGFDFSITRKQSELPSISLTVADPTQDIQARMHAYQGGVDFPVRLKVISTASANTVELEENFTIMAANANSESYMVEFTLGAENPLTLRFPTRLQFRNRCPWRYKGRECGYAGALPTCDFTLNGANGCRAHNNETRFGGFPGIIPTGR